MQDFRALIEQFMADVTVKNAYEIGTEIIRQSGIINEVCQDNSPENLSRKENIEELVNGMNDFCAMRQEEGNTNVSLIDFLSEVSLLTDQDSDKEGDGEKVTLMTVHSAKGLEFRNVFVVGMEENLFPSGMAGDSPRAMEEERRLFYVAITRAEEHCFLSFAKTRFRYGKMEFGSPAVLAGHRHPFPATSAGGRFRPEHRRRGRPLPPRDGRGVFAPFVFRTLLCPSVGRPSGTRTAEGADHRADGPP